MDWHQAIAQLYLKQESNEGDENDEFCSVRFWLLWTHNQGHVSELLLETAYG